MNAILMLAAVAEAGTGLILLGVSANHCPLAVWRRDQSVPAFS